MFAPMGPTAHTTRPQPEPIAVDERRAAAMLGVSPGTIAKQRKAGALPYFRLGTAIRYRVDELKAWAVKQQEKVAA